MRIFCLLSNKKLSQFPQLNFTSADADTTPLGVSGWGQFHIHLIKVAPITPFLYSRRVERKGRFQWWFSQHKSNSLTYQIFWVAIHAWPRTQKFKAATTKSRHWINLQTPDKCAGDTNDPGSCSKATGGSVPRRKQPRRETNLSLAATAGLILYMLQDGVLN